MQAALKAAGGDKGKREQALKGIKEAKAEVKKYKKAQVAARGTVKDVKEAQTVDRDEVRDAFFEAAEEATEVLSEGFIDPFKEVLRKDVPGAIKSLTGGFGKMLKAGGNLLQAKADKSAAAGAVGARWPPCWVSSPGP